MGALPWTIEGDRYQPALPAFVSSNAAPISVDKAGLTFQHGPAVRTPPPPSAIALDLDPADLLHRPRGTPAFPIRARRLIFETTFPDNAEAFPVFQNIFPVNSFREM